ncbi:hypothetical protein [Streptomyces odonnellii]|uniref:hypothetical protein n=1 Tax=Streptomyces odonnellii TaxID=1417980 RepID=UPI000ACF5B83|nr:hypothetical protein [Streptomyces odonnellii]
MAATVARPDIVPYIASWSGEKKVPALVVPNPRGPGIGYADEHSVDRDANGVLWKRVGAGRGKGRPEFGKVHSLRQHRAMRKLLCQVCGGAADRNEDGVLWLVGDYPGDAGGGAGGFTTTHPPVCAPCAIASVRACPHLRKRHVALRAGLVVTAGVQGIVHRPGGLFPEPYDAGGVLYDDTRIHWTVAAQLMVTLRRCTVVELEAEYARYAAQAGRVP